MIYSDQDILDSIVNNKIIIVPFDQNCLNPNSYDLHLSKHLLTYTNEVLDSKKENPSRRIIMDENDGFLLLPGQLYLGSTIEYTSTQVAVPMIEGKSGIARLGISVHITAGLGVVGFDGFWTLEITCTKPVVIYPGMPIAQILFFEMKSKPELTYRGSYYSQGHLPMASKIWKHDFFQKKT